MCGKIADEIEGRTCSQCAAFFVDKEGNIYTHHYPAVCWECWKDLSKRERKEYQRAEVGTL